MEEPGRPAAVPAGPEDPGSGPGRGGASYCQVILGSPLLHILVRMQIPRYSCAAAFFRFRTIIWKPLRFPKSEQDTGIQEANISITVPTY